MVVRRTKTSASVKKAARKAAIEVDAKKAPKQAAAKKTVPKRAAAPSQAAIMLNELRPSVEALHDRVEKLRLRFA